MWGWAIALGFLALIASGGTPVLIALVSVIALVATVWAVNFLGSMTALLIIPRTPERWARLRRDDNESARFIAVYYRWRHVTPLAAPEAAVWGFLVGFAWSAVALTPVYLAVRPHLKYPGLIFVVLVLLFASRAARTAVCNNLLIDELRDEQRSGASIS